MSDIHLPYIERSAALRQDGQRCRTLWAAVVLHAIGEACLRIRNATDKGFHHGVVREIEDFRRWARSRDGREVLTNAGIEPTERAVEQLVGAVISDFAAGRNMSVRSSSKKAGAQ